MSFRYETFGDASMQLNGTLMMSENGPVYLLQQDDWIFSVFNVFEFETKTIDIREAELTFAPLRLGYVNYPNGRIIYLVREPRRMWKQGLALDNISAIRGKKQHDLLTSTNLARTLQGYYPSLKQAYENSTINGKSTAFSRDFALLGEECGEIPIEYKGVVIGIVNEAGNFEINDKYLYMKEILEELVNEKG